MYQLNHVACDVLKEMEVLTYLHAILDKNELFDTDIKERIRKVWTTILQLNIVLNSKELLPKTNIRIINTNVETVLVYSAEAWKTSTTIPKNIWMFITNCLY